jgi:dihydroorotase
VRAEEKILPFAQSTPGVSAMEFLLPMCIAWADEDKIDYPFALSRISSRPAGLLGAPDATSFQLQIGSPANLCLFQTGAQAHWHAHFGTLRSNGQFSPFNAEIYTKPLPAKVLRTWVLGREVYNVQTH